MGLMYTPKRIFTNDFMRQVVVSFDLKGWWRPRIEGPPNVHSGSCLSAETKRNAYWNPGFFP